MPNYCTYCNARAGVCSECCGAVECQEDCSVCGRMETVSDKRALNVGRYNLLAVNADAKTSKGTGIGYLTGILYLSPADMSGWNVCQFATEGCKAVCLNTAGRGIVSSVQRGRLRKTRLLFQNRPEFERQLAADIVKLARYAKRLGLTPLVRLNGTSDLPWHRMRFQGHASPMEAFPTIQFYDYTKDSLRLVERMPANYDLTFSRSESNDLAAYRIVASGLGRVAVVFAGAIPTEYLGMPVVNGDASDVRVQDPKGVWVGLKAKGKAKRDVSGFVVR
jgi:hypothetical protein